MIEHSDDRICVVHLVWAPFGPDRLRSFLSTYSSFRSGTGHSLLMVFNGFTRDTELAPYWGLLAGYEQTSILLEQPVQDIDAYFAAAARHPSRYYCFLNSYSRILADDWLLKMYNHASHPSVGLVGATGSWESMYTNYLAECDAQKGTWLAKRTKALHNHRFKLIRFKRYFRGFPNHHLRTNGFMISREILMGLKHNPVRSKLDAYRFESGRNGLTAQVLKTGRTVLVVDRDGKAYDINQWDRSATFKQDDQEKLLIADNQTDRYIESDPESRRVLWHAAWNADGLHDRGGMK